MGSYLEPIEFAMSHQPSKNGFEIFGFKPSAQIEKPLPMPKNATKTALKMERQATTRRVMSAKKVNSQVDNGPEIHFLRCSQFKNPTKTNPQTCVHS